MILHDTIITPRWLLSIAYHTCHTSLKYDSCTKSGLMDRATSPVNPLTIGSCELAISAVQSGRARFPHPLLSHKPGRSRIVANPLVRPPSWRPLPLQFRLLRRPSTSTAGRQIRWLLSTTSLFPPLPSPSPTTRHPADTQAPAAASTFAQAVDPRRDLSPPPPTAPDAEA